MCFLTKKGRLFCIIIFLSNAVFTNFSARSILGFSVYVSNTTERLQGTICFKDTHFTKESVPAELTIFTTECPSHGQYVIYYNERLPSVDYPVEYSTLVESDLCEVEVYGELFFFIIFFTSLNTNTLRDCFQ